jgi:hypothetical protein
LLKRHHHVWGGVFFTQFFGNHVLSLITHLFKSIH